MDLDELKEIINARMRLKATAFLNSPDGAEFLADYYSGFAAIRVDEQGEVRHVPRAEMLEADESTSSPKAGQEKMMDWQPIETAPKNKKLLVAYQNRLGNWRIVTGCYHTQLPWSDEHWREDDDESEYAPEGWYEESDSSETIYQTDHPPTHWMPLPEPPK